MKETKLYLAFLNSLKGLTRSFHEERAVRQEILLLMAGIPISAIIASNFLFFILLVGSLLFVLAVELLNTGIEKLCDHVTPGHHITIGYIKDLGSAAVLCALSLAILVWGYAFYVFLS